MGPTKSPCLPNLWIPDGARPRSTAWPSDAAEALDEIYETD
jgi:hypothetical protein